jgi:Na+-driven multidrug efflux pump
MRNATVYFFITALSYPAISQFKHVCAAVSLHRKLKAPNDNRAFMNVIHFGLNALFIYGYVWVLPAQRSVRLFRGIWRLL